MFYLIAIQEEKKIRIQIPFQLFNYEYFLKWGFLGGSVVKNPPAMQEMWVQSLGREDTPGEGNINPLQFSCLGTPMDRGGQRATVYGVAKSWT